MEARIKHLEIANKSLEDKVENLESRLHVSENVYEQLTVDLDRLDQYHRRSNVIVFLPERESFEDVTKKKLITKTPSFPTLKKIL